MKKYHKYVFDQTDRSFVGDFENMYQDEVKYGFDSWHQEDTRQLNREIALSILKGWNFQSILDIGCGKGGLTHLLKRHNNQALGIDISQTAIDIAKSRYSDIKFDVVDINAPDLLIESLNSSKGMGDTCVDLVVTSETLSYLENWEEVISIIGRHSRYLLISLFIPDDPIGFVKTPDQLQDVVSESFVIIEAVIMKNSKFIVIFAESKSIKED